ncbi:MAG: dTMP kinase [Planctomycetia bacterium]|nr:dTMP kinase [Planctomycetia bacterium]
MFISIDGGDGTGKSLQISLLKKYFEKQQKEVILCREPGSTRLGEAIRNILLNENGTKISVKSEMFLFMAARAQLVEEIIRPALQKNQIVLCDRFLLSTLVYQGIAVQDSMEEIWKIGEIAVDTVWPNLMILLDVDPTIALQRIKRPLDRMESKGIDFHQRVRAGFLKAADKWNQIFPNRCIVVDSSGTPEQVSQTIQNIVDQILFIKY